MATTIKTWKETYIHKNPKILGIFKDDDKYEILFKQKLSDDHQTVWINAYVKLPDPLKDKYNGESYRHENIIGVDTIEHTTATNQEEIAYNKIVAIIDEHYDKA